MKTVVLFFLLSLTTSLLGQQSLNPNNVLTISKEGKKREFAFRTGQTIKCRLKDGDKVKGTLYVYADYLFIDDTKVNFHEIKMIKEVNYRAVTNVLGGIGSGLLLSSTTNIIRNELFWFGNAAFLGIALTFSNRKFKPDKGWNLVVKEISPFDSQRRR